MCEVELYHFQLLSPILSETPTAAHVSLQTCDTAVLDFVDKNLLVVATLGMEPLVARPGHPAKCGRGPLSRLQVVVCPIAICLLYSTEYS